MSRRGVAVDEPEGDSPHRTTRASAVREWKKDVEAGGRGVPLCSLKHATEQLCGGQPPS